MMYGLGLKVVVWLGARIPFLNSLQAILEFFTIGIHRVGYSAFMSFRVVKSRPPLFGSFHERDSSLWGRCWGLLCIQTPCGIPDLYHVMQCATACYI